MRPSLFRIPTKFLKALPSQQQTIKFSSHYSTTHPLDSLQSESIEPFDFTNEINNTQISQASSHPLNNTIKKLESSHFNTSDDQPAALYESSESVPRVIDNIESEYKSALAAGQLSKDEFFRYIVLFLKHHRLLQSVDVLIDMKNAGFNPDLSVYELIFRNAAKTLPPQFSYSVFVDIKTSPNPFDNALAKIVRHLMAYIRREKLIPSTNFYIFLVRKIFNRADQIENTLSLLLNRGLDMPSDLIAHLIKRKAAEKAPLTEMKAIVAANFLLKKMNTRAVTLYVNYLIQNNYIKELFQELESQKKENQLTAPLLIATAGTLASAKNYTALKDFYEFNKTLAVQNFAVDQVNYTSGYLHHYVEEMAPYPCYVPYAINTIEFLITRNESKVSGEILADLKSVIEKQNDLNAQLGLPSSFLAVQIKHAIAFNQSELRPVFASLYANTTSRSAFFIESLLRFLHINKTSFSTNAILGELLTKDHLLKSLAEKGLAKMELKLTAQSNTPPPDISKTETLEYNADEAVSLEEEVDVPEALEDISEKQTGFPVDFFYPHVTKLDPLSKTLFLILFSYTDGISSRLAVLFLNALHQQAQAESVITLAKQLLSHRSVSRQPLLNYPVITMLLTTSLNKDDWKNLSFLAGRIIECGGAIPERLLERIKLAAAGDKQARHFTFWNRISPKNILRENNSRSTYRDAQSRGRENNEDEPRQMREPRSYETREYSNETSRENRRNQPREKRDNKGEARNDYNDSNNNGNEPDFESSTRRRDNSHKNSNQDYGVKFSS